MSTPASKLFTFNRDLPNPFNTLKSKKVKVASQYSPTGTEATLNATVVKAVQAMCNCRNGTGQGAIGQIDHRCVAEYKSAAGPDIYHLAVFDPNSGNMLASIYDVNTEVMELYSVNKSERDGAALMMVMLPSLLSDDEFKEHFDAYFDCHTSGFPDLNEAASHMAYLCDNAYRRIIDDTCPAHINIKVDASGNMMRISSAQLEAGTFTPKAVLAGEFTIFAQTGPVPIYAPANEIEHEDFIGKYPLNINRTLNAREERLIPQLPIWYIIPEQIKSICEHAMRSTDKTTPMRNFLLRGPAGTGKTAGAMAVAAGFGLPYVKYTCSANTEVFDFIGQVFPETAIQSTGDADLDKERETLNQMGGITFENMAKLMGLPGLDDMDYDPEGVYHALTGTNKPNASSQDCMAVVFDKVTEKVRQLSLASGDDNQKTGQTYTYVETDFVRALKYGYCCEIQEPSTIMQPGVLVGLNSLLEQNGSITLPTGEVIKRHPDAVVIVTTNISYEGCRGINRATRFPLKRWNAKPLGTLARVAINP